MLADRDARMDRVRPALDAMVSAGFSYPSFVFGLRREVSTATLGTVSSRRACRMRMSIDLVPRVPSHRWPMREVPPDPATLGALLAEIHEGRQTSFALLVDGIIE